MFASSWAEVLLSSSLNCPGVNETAAGSKPQVWIGLVIQSTELLQEAVGSSEKQPAIVDLGSSYHDMNGLEYSSSLSFAQTAKAQIESINHNPTILPHHHVCLLTVVYPSNHPRAKPLDTKLILSRHTPAVVVNMIHDADLHNEHQHLLSYFYLLISVKQKVTNQCIIPSLAIEAFTHTLQAIGEDNSCPNSYETILNMKIGQRELLVSVSAFTKAMEWNRVGILFDCHLPRLHLTKEWSKGNSLICFSEHNSDSFEETFQTFADYGILIYVFLGKLESYYQFLRRAYNHGIVGKR